MSAYLETCYSWLRRGLDVSGPSTTTLLRDMDRRLTALEEHRHAAGRYVETGRPLPHDPHGWPVE